MAPPKADESLIPVFQSISLPAQKTTEAIRSPKISSPLKGLIEEFDLSSKNLDEKQATLLFQLVGTKGYEGLTAEQRGYVVERIRDRGLEKGEQVNGELDFLHSHGD
jgi:glutaminyl-tRNA synthetase